MNIDLKEIQQPVKKLLIETDRSLQDQVISSIELVSRINRMAPISRGKKIRSTLLFLLAAIRNSLSHSHELTKIAASIEMFHLSSLVHDDVVDNSALRRGERTLNNNMGNHLSVLWGDYLFISAFIQLNNLGKKKLMDIILDAAHLMVEGQILEIENESNLRIKHETYIDIINKKTSSLFAAVTQIVSALSDDPPETREKYRQFGLDIGTIFQISDDMLDIFSDKTGKDRFSDLKEGKITLPYILLLKKCPGDISKYLLDKDENRLLSLFEENNINKLVLEQIHDYYQKTLAFMESFPDSIYKKSLLQLIEFIKYREY